MSTTTARRRVLMLEFNELCPSLLDRWMAAGELPNFRRIYEASDAFTTLADAEAPALEPWIQWYSVHTGLDYGQHQVFRLSDGPLRDFPDMWSMARAAGRRVMNFSSMNAKGFAGEGCVFMPDPWCTSERAWPTELNTFFDFVSKNVQEYSNADQGVGLGDYARFAGFLAGHGLSWQTLSATLRQLAGERTTDPGSSWKRVTILDAMCVDVFAHYYRKTRPDLATLFLNSTAHLQHSYWRCMDPGSFVVQPSPKDVERFGDAILLGYRSMDRLLGRILSLVESDTMVVFATALSQQPFLKWESIGGQRFYRPRDVHALLGHLGIAPRVVQPVMTHQYQLRFDTAAAQEEATRRLEACRHGEEALFLVQPKEDLTVYIGCQLRRAVSEDERIHLGEAGEAAFWEHFYMIDAMKSGCHHPDGALWFRTGTQQLHPEKVSILDIMPTVMGALGVPVPVNGAYPYKGRALPLGVPAEPALRKVA